MWGQAGIYYKLAGYWRGVKRYGVRTVSATSMALLENSEKRISVLELATGDLIILMGKDGVGHVIFIVGIENNSIECIHNSSESAKPYVHTFTIEITNPDLSIEKQVWHENNIHGQSFLEAFELNDTITGVYRPRFLCQ
jgi:hypothetical protein